MVARAKEKLDSLGIDWDLVQVPFVDLAKQNALKCSDIFSTPHENAANARSDCFGHC